MDKNSMRFGPTEMKGYSAMHSVERQVHDFRRDWERERGRGERGREAEREGEAGRQAGRERERERERERGGTWCITGAHAPATS